MNESTPQARAPRDRVAAQQRKAAHQLRTVAGGLHEVAAKTGQYAPAAREAAERINSAASYLEQREPADVLREAREFARRRPGVVLASAAAAALVVRRRPGLVLAGAAAAGLAASRLARGAGGSRQTEPAAAIPAPPDPAWTPTPEQGPSGPAGSAPYYPASGVSGPGAAGPEGPGAHGPEPYQEGEQS
jgi:hypothetical protein